MSRSRKHRPGGGNLGGSHRSERRDKKTWHRNFRSLTKRLARQGEDDHEAFSSHGRQLVSNPWSMNKDGKRYWAGAPSSYLRK